jgi:hypothetical protein
MQDSDDNALKVSFMLTDSDGGLEAGDNAVMVEGFADGAMMTNQQPLSFGTNGALDYDPLNFELPNLAYGSYASTQADRAAAQAAITGFAQTDGSMWDNLADALDADSIMNDWAAFETADGTVNADWVVTLPGQYVMVDPICEIYNTYTQASSTAALAACATAGATYAAAATGGADRNQLPLTIATTNDGLTLVEGSNMNMWDREELALAGEDSDPEDPDPELGFSPGGSSGDPADPQVTVIMPNEVNVVDFGAEDAASALVSDLKLTVTPPEGSDRGWARLDITPNPAQDPMIWGPAATADDADITPAAGAWGTWTAVDDADDVAVVGFAVWQRSFAAQAGNYGRMVEHSTITSTSNSRSGQ